MPLTSRDILFVLRAQDFASREVRNLAGNFGMLNKQMRAVATEGSARLQTVEAARIKQVRSAENLYTRRTALLRTDNAAIGHTIARLREQNKWEDISAQQKRANAREISRLTTQRAANNEKIAEGTRLYQRQSRIVTRRAEDAKRAIKEEIALNEERIQAHQALARHHQATGAAMVAVGAIMTGVGVAGLFGITQLTKGAAEFRQQIALAQTQAQDIGLTIGQLESTAYSVGRAIPVPLEQLATGLYDIFSSIDVNLKQGADLLRGFSRDAVAGQVELEDASRANISVLNAWGKEIGESADISDILFRLVERGIGSYGEFTNSIGRAIPATVRFGQEFETLGASMAFLTRQGLSTEQAATSAARAMELLADPRVVERMEQQGVVMRDARGDFLPMVDILSQMNMLWGDLTSAERSKAMLDTFGGAGYRIQARRFFDTVIPNFQAFNIEIGRMEDRAGAARRAFITMASQPVSQIQLLKNNIQILANEFGEHFFGALNRILSIGRTIVDFFSGLDSSTKGVIAQFIAWSSVILVVGGALTILVGIAKMLYGTLLSLRVVQGLTMGLSALSGALGGTTAAMSGAATAGGVLRSVLWGPAGIAVAAAAIIGIGLAKWAKNSSDALALSSDAAANLAESAGGAFASIEDLSGGLEGAVDSAGAFAAANQDIIRELQTLDKDAARGKLLEIAMQLRVRSDLEPEEIQEQIDRLAAAAQLNLEVPVRIEDATLRATIDSAMTRIAEGIQSRWASSTLISWDDFWNVGLNSLKAEIADLGELIGASFMTGVVPAQEFGAEVVRLVDQIRAAAPNAHASAGAINQLVDSIARGAGVTGQDAINRISDFNSLIAEMGAIGQLTKTDLWQLQLSLDGVDTGFTDAEASVRLELAALADIPSAAAGAAGGTQDLAEAQGLLQDETEEATSALKDQLDLYRGIADPMFAAIKALENYQSAQKALDELGADATAEEIAEANRKLMFSHFDLRGSLEGLVDENNNLIATSEEVVAMLAEIGMPQSVLDQAAADTSFLIDLLMQISKDWDIPIHVVTDAERRLAAIRTLVNGLDGRVAYVHIRTVSSGSGRIPVGTQHEGGHAGDYSGVRDLLNLRRDEVPAILQKGEYVLSRRMVGELRMMTRFHNGGGFGPYSGAGATAQGIVGSAGGSSESIQKAIDKVNELSKAWEEAQRQIEEAKERTELLAAINTAEDAEARAAATERLHDFDVQRAIANEQAAIQRALETAEMQKQLALERERIAANREQWRFDRMSTRQQIADIEKRLKAEQAFTDEWVRLANLRIQKYEELAAAAQQAADTAQSNFDTELAELNRMLDEHDRIRDQMQDREADYKRSVADQHKSYAESVKNAQEDATKAIEDAIAARRSALESEFARISPDDSAMNASTMGDLLEAQNTQFKQWRDGIEELKRRGLSDDVVQALGIADSPEQLRNVQNLLNGSVTDLDRINALVQQRQQYLNEIVEEESTNTAYALANEIQGIQSDLASNLADLKQEHVVALAELSSSFKEDMSAMRADLRAIGRDNGRSWAEAIAAGIATGLPAIVKQVKKVQSLLRTLKAAQAQAAEATAQAELVAKTTGIVADLKSTIRGDISSPGDVEAIVKLVKQLYKAYGVPITGDLRNIAWELFIGATSIAALEKNLKAASTKYDSGGVLSPGYTLAYNGTGKNEYIYTEPMSGGVQVIVERGALEFTGTVDAATIPEVEDLLTDFAEHIADQIRKQVSK